MNLITIFSSDYHKLVSIFDSRDAILLLDGSTKERGTCLLIKVTFFHPSIKRKLVHQIIQVQMG